MRKKVCEKKERTASITRKILYIFLPCFDSIDKGENDSSKKVMVLLEVNNENFYVTIKEEGIEENYVCSVSIAALNYNRQ